MLSIVASMYSRPAESLSEDPFGNVHSYPDFVARQLCMSSPAYFPARALEDMLRAFLTFAAVIKKQTSHAHKASPPQPKPKERYTFSFAFATSEYNALAMPQIMKIELNNVTTEKEG